MRQAKLKALLITFICMLNSVGYGDLRNSVNAVGRREKVFSSAVQTSKNDNGSKFEKAGIRKHPNLLLVGIETFRADHSSFLGYHKNTCPCLAGLAKEGTIFSKVMATSSWTMPTVMSVFTSLYPGAHGITNHQKLPGQIETLAEILKANGYLTAAFVSNPALDGCYGFSKGFDIYDDFSVKLELDMNLFLNDEVPVQRFCESRTNGAVNRAAFRWLNDNGAEKFFMFIFYFDPHYDYIPPAPFDIMFDPNYEGTIDGRGIISKSRRNIRPPQRDLDHVVALYDGEVRYTDLHFSKLLDKLRGYGILDDTLIVIFGDHGEEFYEHGSSAHGHALYNELIHVPLVFRWPEAIPKDRGISALVSQVDIMPTILDYLAIQQKGFVQGKSLRALIEGRDDKLHEVVYSEVGVEKNKHFAAVMSEDEKLILDIDTNKKELFDLKNDPTEQINIYERKASMGPVLLEGRLAHWLTENEKLHRQLTGHKGVEKAELNEYQLRQLRSLGYVQ